MKFYKPLQKIAYFTNKKYSQISTIFKSTFKKVLEKSSSENRKLIS